MIMRRLYTLFIGVAVAFATFSASAQDARQRTVPTIVQDCLAQMPAATEADLNREMLDLALNAPQTVEVLCSMLKPATEGLNSKIEYALNGLVNFVGGAEGGQYRAAVANGLASASEAVPDEHKAFVLSRLALIAGEEQIPLFVKFASDRAVSSVAVNALISIPGSGDAIMQMFADGNVSRPLLAYAAAEKKIAAAEPYLIAWIEETSEDRDSDPTSLGDTPDLKAYTHALALCGGEKALPVLQKISAYDHLTLLKRLADEDRGKVALAGVKEYVNSEDNVLRCGALGVLVSAKGKKAQKDLLNALCDSDKIYRNVALEYASGFAGDARFVKSVKKKFAKLGADAQVDVINWAGANELQEFAPVVQSMVADSNKEIALAAIRATGKIGGKDAAGVLFGQLGGNYSYAAYDALMSLDEDITAELSGMLDAGGDKVRIALDLVGRRCVKALAPKVMELAKSTDTSTSLPAYVALTYVSGPEDFPVLLGWLEEENTAEPVLIEVLCRIVKSVPAQESFALVRDAMQASAYPARYYPLLAAIGTEEAVAVLMEAYKVAPDEAFKAMCNVKEFYPRPLFYEIARNDASKHKEALFRVIDWTVNCAEHPIYKVGALATVLGMTQDVYVRVKAVDAIGQFPLRSAFILAASCLDDPQTAYPAACAVKNIAAKTEEELDYHGEKEALEKARTIFANTWGADNAYAVDEITKMLSELREPSDKFVLPADEAAAGFEVLFDGTDMSNFTGALNRYTLINGTIYVTANYGGGGNLYTKKEYSDFVFRFEFCFEVPGVNNGVGIRTPHDVDAAFDAMAEIQILDHDDPIYAGLNDYQVHGSAYGVIPAKRVVHKPLGTWNTEEIRVVGDRVTVTLNGEVILDGDLREACQGHNIAPDGGTYNPYTVDHRNHPGMFNKKGHISFCGHGPGIRFRNIRVLDLTK